MTISKESERKFIVKLPSSWAALSELFDDLVDIKRIQQSYLKPEGKEPSARVRKTIAGLTGDKEVSYDFNQKFPIETGVHKEKEYSISKSEYEKHLENTHPDKAEIEKTGFVFEYNDQTFELDVFKGRLKGLAILEIELNDIDDTVEFPPFLKSVKEVTDDKRFSNFNLANKK